MTCTPSGASAAYFTIVATISSSHESASATATTRNHRVTDVRASVVSDIEAKRPQLLAAVVGDLVRPPRRHPDPVDLDVGGERLRATGQGGVGLVLDHVGQR